MLSWISKQEVFLQGITNYVDVRGKSREATELSQPSPLSPLNLSEPAFVECSLCVRHCSKNSTHINSSTFANPTR